MLSVLREAISKRREKIKYMKRDAKKDIKISRTEKETQENEKRFIAVAESTADLIWEGDIRHDCLTWFGDIDACLGYAPGEFPRTVTGHMESVHPLDLKQFLATVEESINTGKDFYSVYRMRCRNGTYRSWEERGKAVGFEKGKAVKWVGAITDITDHKHTEEKLIRAEEKFKKISLEFNTLLDAIPDELILLTPDMNILWANKVFASKFNKKVSELYGTKCYKLCCNLASPCKNCPVIKCFRSGKEEVTQVMNTEGNILDKRAFPVLDESGEVKNVIEVARDITAKIRMEEEAQLLQSQLVHTNKMTSLGTLVSGVAHEINNPNSFILHNARTLNKIWLEAVEVLSRYCQEKGDFKLAGISFHELKTLVPEILSGVNEGAVRIKNIVENLRNFSRPEITNPAEEVNVNKVIMASRAILNNHIKQYTNRFYIKCADNIPFVSGSSQKIEQVLINIIMNALQSLPDNTHGVSVTTSHDKRSNNIVIKVMDKGTGIPENILERITEPFFTTRLESGGTGLGLSISYAIVKEHGGSLLFKSKEGTGTTVIIRFPAIKGSER